MIKEEERKIKGMMEWGMDVCEERLNNMKREELKWVVGGKGDVSVWMGEVFGGEGVEFGVLLCWVVGFIDKVKERD
ncbi:hypothetical protein, partial [Bacillus velezensis]|uniref:hypothetical protein n=1 Tax=Bacillus velezensis TaxID=492670 RepID=UPI0011A44105